MATPLSNNTQQDQTKVVPRPCKKEEKTSIAGKDQRINDINDKIEEQIFHRIEKIKSELKCPEVGDWAADDEFCSSDEQHQPEEKLIDITEPKQEDVALTTTEQQQEEEVEEEQEQEQEEVFTERSGSRRSREQTEMIEEKQHQDDEDAIPSQLQQHHAPVPPPEHDRKRIHPIPGERGVPYVIYPSQHNYDNWKSEMYNSRYYNDADRKQIPRAKMFVGNANNQVTFQQLEFIFLWAADAVIYDGEPCGNHHCFYVWIDADKVDTCRRLMHRRIMLDNNGFYYAETIQQIEFLQAYGTDGLGLIKTVSNNEKNIENRNIFQRNLAAGNPLTSEEESVLCTALLKNGRPAQRPHAALTITYVPENSVCDWSFNGLIAGDATKWDRNNEYSPLCNCSDCKQFYGEESFGTDNLKQVTNDFDYRNNHYANFLIERQQSFKYSPVDNVLPSINPNDEDSVFDCHSNFTDQIYREIGPNKLQKAHEAQYKFFYECRPDILPCKTTNEYKGNRADEMCCRVQKLKDVYQPTRKDRKSTQNNSNNNNIVSAPASSGNPNNNSGITLYFCEFDHDTQSNVYVDENTNVYHYSTFAGLVYQLNNNTNQMS
jgi:hypothetical protein